MTSRALAPETAAPPRSPREISCLYLFSAVIDLALVLLLVVLLPWILYLVLIKRRGVGSLSERLGRVHVPPPAGPRIWVHAVSVGEFEAARPLIDALGRYRSGDEVVISTTTTTALGVARQKSPGPTFLFPLDLGICVRRALRRIRPAVIVLMELELWPNLILAADLFRVPVVVANGRISEEGFRRMHRCRWFLRPFFRRLSAVLVQNDVYRARLEALGVPSDRLKITGNLKHDRPPLERPESIRRSFEAEWRYPQGSGRWIAGCTHAGEEEIVLECHLALRDRVGSLGLILAPRHVERADEVERKVRERGLSVRRFSQGPAGDPPDVLIVDVTGELVRLYACADVAFVGGSLVPRGGHNIMEPLLADTATLHGPFTANFADAVRIFTQGGATLEVGDAGALLEQVEKWLSDREKRSAHVCRGRELLEQHRGAARTSAEAISKLVSTRAGSRGCG